MNVIRLKNDLNQKIQKFCIFYCPILQWIGTNVGTIKLYNIFHLYHVYLFSKNVNQILLNPVQEMNVRKKAHHKKLVWPE